MIGLIGLRHATTLLKLLLAERGAVLTMKLRRIENPVFQRSLLVTRFVIFTKWTKLEFFCLLPEKNLHEKEDKGKDAKK